MPQRQARGDRNSVAVARRVDDRQHAGGIGDDVRERAGGKPRVERKRDRAGAHRAEEEFDELGAVPDQHGDALARAYAEPRQHARHGIHPLIELPVGRAALLAAEQIDDRNLVRRARNGLVEEEAQIALTIQIVHAVHARSAASGARIAARASPCRHKLTGSRRTRLPSHGLQLRSPARGCDEKVTHAANVPPKPDFRLAGRAKQVTLSSPNHGRFLLH